VYITSDNINNTLEDNTRINNIVTALQQLGLFAVNYGLGPNEHYSILQNITIPQNALIVDIYGGFCAGTIWEMNQSYYKYYKGNRTVFSIWIDTPITLDDIQFLPRAQMIISHLSTAPLEDSLILMTQITMESLNQDLKI
jgi:hypothetical protein